MSELRWILLAAGLLLIAGIYFFGTRARRRSAGPTERAIRVEPTAPAAMPPPTLDVERVEPSLSPADELAPGPEPDELTIDFDEPAINRVHGRREPTLGTEAPVVVQRSPELPAAPPERAAEPRPTREPEPAPPPEREVRPQQRIVAVRVVAVPPLRFEGAKLLESIRSEGLEYGRYEIFHNLHGDGRPIFSLASLREPGTFDLDAMPTAAFPGLALFAVLPGPVPAVEAFDQLIFSARAFAAQLGGTLADDRGAPLTVHRITRLREEMVEYDRQYGGVAG